MGKARLCCAGGIGKLVAQGAPGNDHAAVDGRGCRSWLLGRLESYVVRQRRSECALSDNIGFMHSGPPTKKVQKVHGVTAQRGFGEAAGAFAIQKTINPLHFTAGLCFDDMEGTSCAATRLMDYLECHGRAASRRRWNCRASPPWTKKLFGSWPSGSETVKAVKPCSLRRGASRCAAW